MLRDLKNMKIDKIIIHDKVIPSRYFLAPINTGFAFEGIPSDNLIKFHEDRSGNNIGVSYIGNVSIDKKFVTNRNTLYFDQNTTNNLAWLRLIDTIKTNGSLCGIQLGCNYSNYSAIRNWKNKNAKSYIDLTQRLILSLSEREIFNIQESFVNSIIKADSLGIDVIQIHATHGYFLSNFLNRILNKRSDIFGFGKLFLIENIITKIRKNLPNSLIDIRISLIDGVEDEKEELKYKYELIEKLCSLNIDIFSVSNGIYNINKRLIYPPIQKGHLNNLGYILPLAKKYSNKFWSISGNIWNLFEIPLDIPDNIFFGIGRSLIADPQFVYKYYNNDENRINHCQRNNRCHYYSRNVANIACPKDKFLSNFI